MANRVAGVAFLKANGQQYPLRGNLTVSPSRSERTGIAGQDGVHGFSEMPRVPFISGDVTLDPALSMEALYATRDATITAELANGKVYVLRSAWYAGPQDLNAAEGMVNVRFEGLDCDELV